ncbi:MAG: hypothetical protein H6Q90_1059, partial [Deltaproteobacteria bacterium]|nr:hypothetical protein [Deltaproteobacteria bacterium]
AAPRADGAVPTWVLDVVRRGLRPQPADRWPSMLALVAALGADPIVARRQRLQRGGVVAALGALAGLAVFGLSRGAAVPDTRCQGMDHKLRGVWDPDRAQAVRAAFAATNRPYATTTFGRVSDRLDGYTSRWTAARVEACEATQLRGDQSAALMDLRMACLDRRLAEVGALVDVLATGPNAEVLDKAVGAVEQLSPLVRCDDVDALRAVVSPPADPETRAKVDELRRTLAQLNALFEIGWYRTGLPVAQRATTAAEQLGYAPLLAELLHRRARLEDGTGDAKAAAATLEQALPVAASAHDDPLAAQLWADLVFVVGIRLARPDDALRLRPGAEAALRRAGEVPDAEIKFWTSLADVDSALGKYAEAQQSYERALAINERLLGPDDHRFIGSVLNNLGVVLKVQGKYEEARRHYERALAIDEKALGPDHPHLAYSLTNLGVVLGATGKSEEAQRYNERALAILEKALGPDHPDVARLLDNVGAELFAQHRYDDAHRHFARARAIFEKAVGPDHPDLAACLANLGAVAFAQGKHDDAARHFDRAVAIYEKALGPDHPDVATPLNNLGDVLAIQGKPDEARQRYERALAIYEKALGPDHPDLGYPLTGLGAVLLTLGRSDQARAHAERAVRIREAGNVPPEELAESRFLLARVLWARSAARPRALELARQARDGFAGVGDDESPQLEKVKTWLHARRED